MERSHISNRGLLSIDVAEAIDSLVTKAGDPLPRPMALKREQVLAQLLVMVESSDGTYRRLPAGIRDAMSERYANRLANSAVFQAGYTHYEEQSKNPVVPVTNFFFNSIYSNDGSIDLMTDFEVQHSLPHRKSQVNPTLDPGKTKEQIEAMKYDLIESGPIAGIVVFPPGYGARRREGENPILIRQWLLRGVNRVDGMASAISESLIHIRPDTKAALGARDVARQMGPGMRQALPRRISHE